jgi:hypothetical protein
MSANVRLEGRNQRRPADKGGKINAVITFFRNFSEGRLSAAFRMELNAAFARDHTNDALQTGPNVTSLR